MKISVNLFAWARQSPLKEFLLLCLVLSKKKVTPFFGGKGERGCMAEGGGRGGDLGDQGGGVGGNSREERKIMRGFEFSMAGLFLFFSLVGGNSDVTEIPLTSNQPNAPAGGGFHSGGLTDQASRHGPSLKTPHREGLPATG